jgi:O-antigen/teichoic acid export membrane protein
VKRHLYSLGRQTIVYGVSAAVLQLVGVVTLPIFARAFSPGEYGAVEIATVGIGALLVFADIGLASASQRSYFDYGDDDAVARGAVLTTALATGFAAASVLAALVVLFREPIAEWLFHSSDEVSLVVLVALAVPLTILATFTREVMRLRFMAWSYTASAIMSAAVAAILSVYLVLATDAGPDGVIIGLVAGNAVAALFGLVVVGRHLGARLSGRELRIMLAYGLPLVPAAAAMWGLAFLDRVMLSRLTDLDEVGQFAVGARVALVLTLCVTAFGLAYSPFMLSLFAEDRVAEKEVRGRTLTYVTVALVGISLILALFARELIAVVAPDYDEGYEVVGILCIGVAIYGMSTVAMAGISLVRRTGYFALYSLAALVVNVALNLALIPPLGGVGAALATASAYACLFVLYYRRAQALYPTPYAPGHVLLVLLLGAALMPVGLLGTGIGAVALKLLALAAFAVGLVVSGVIGRDELTELRDVVRRFSRRTAASA